MSFDENGNQRRAVPMIFYGAADDAGEAAAMFGEWCELIVAMARMRFGGVFRGPGRSYAEGFVTALLKKVRTMRAAERKAIESGDRAALAEAIGSGNGDGSSLALVSLRGMESALKRMDKARDGAKAWLRNKHGVKLGSSSRGAGGKHHADAHAQGKVDGQRAGFSRGASRRRIGS